MSKLAVSRNSQADRISPRALLALERTLCTAAKEGTARKVTCTELGAGGQRMLTAVMMPRVPSDPMKSCLRS